MEKVLCICKPMHQCVWSRARIWTQNKKVDEENTTKAQRGRKKIDRTKKNNVQFVVAKPQSPLLPPLFHGGERSHSVVECDRLRVIKPLTHCCSCSRANPHRTHCSLTSERCNLLSRRHEVLLTNAHCQRQSQCEAVAQIKMLWPRKLLNICLKPFFLTEL